MDLFCIFGKDRDAVQDGLSPSLIECWDEFRVDVFPDDFDAVVARHRAHSNWAEVRVVIVKVDDTKLKHSFQIPQIEGSIE